MTRPTCGPHLRLDARARHAEVVKQQPARVASSHPMGQFLRSAGSAGRLD
jgi:hypothetical protein